MYRAFLKPNVHRKGVMTMVYCTAFLSKINCEKRPGDHGTPLEQCCEGPEPESLVPAGRRLVSAPQWAPGHPSGSHLRLAANSEQLGRKGLHTGQWEQALPSVLPLARVCGAHPWLSAQWGGDTEG